MVLWTSLLTFSTTEQKKIRTQEEPSNEDALEHAKATIVAEVANKLKQNEAISLVDAFDALNNILSQLRKPPLSKSLYLLDYLKQELSGHLDVLYIKGARRYEYMLLRTGGDLQHALYCALLASVQHNQNQGRWRWLITTLHKETKLMMTWTNSF